MMDEVRTLQSDDQVAWDVTIVREKPGCKCGGTKKLKTTDQRMHERPAYIHTLSKRGQRRLPITPQRIWKPLPNAGPPTSTERIGLCHGAINKIVNPTHKGLSNPRG